MLDGFTVTGGQADGSGFKAEGGGLYCKGNGAGSVCDATFRNLHVIGNYAGFGGGLCNNALNGGQSSPTITNVTFSYNHADQNGGGVFNYTALTPGTSAPVLTGVTFVGNSAGLRGGAIMNAVSSGTVSPSIANATFSGNSAGTGGAIATWSLSAGVSAPQLTNVTFNANTANKGGALANEVNATGSVDTTLINGILWGDSVSGVGSAGPEIYNAGGGTVAISYSVIEGAFPAGLWDTSLGTDGGNNLETDPLLGPLGDNGGPTQTFPLISGSSAIDAGDAAACAAAPVSNKDQHDRTRPVDGDFDATATCDIGAYEYAGHLFADVPVVGKEWMEPWVEMFYYNGITTGCGAGPLIYCPESAVTRAAMAVFILRAKYGASYVPPAATHTFSDMPVVGKEWMEPWVDQLYAEGITTGCGAGPIFCPESPVTRAAMAVFLLRALEGSSYTPPAATHTFSDMPVVGKEWMEPWVDEFYVRGITTGCGAAPLIYCPENSVTRAAMAVFVDRAYSLYP